MTERLVSIGVKITVLVGGVGGARFLLGVQHLLGLGQFAREETQDHSLTAVVNIGDDAWPTSPAVSGLPNDLGRIGASI